MNSLRRVLKRARKKARERKAFLVMARRGRVQVLPPPQRRAEVCVRTGEWPWVLLGGGNDLERGDVMDTEAEAFEAAAAEVSDRAALRRQIDVLHQEIARLAARPTAARVLMDTLEKVCPWLWQEVVGSDLDPCVGAADPEKIPVLLRAVLDRITGGPPMEAETWQVVCVGRREQEERIFVDVRTRRTREHRCTRESTSRARGTERPRGRGRGAPRAWTLAAMIRGCCAAGSRAKCV